VNFKGNQTMAKSTAGPCQCIVMRLQFLLSTGYGLKHRKTIRPLA